MGNSGASTDAVYRQLGGVEDDYAPLVAWFEQPCRALDDERAYGLLGNSFGIFLAERCFGVTMTRPSDGRCLPTRYAAERLVHARLGRIRTIGSFFRGMPLPAWVSSGAAPLVAE